MKTTTIVMKNVWVLDNRQRSQIADPASAIHFHKMLAIGTMVFMVVTLALVIVRK